jgi:hypothetical protein
MVIKMFFFWNQKCSCFEKKKSWFLLEKVTFLTLEKRTLFPRVNKFCLKTLKQFYLIFRIYKWKQIPCFKRCKTWCSGHLTTEWIILSQSEVSGPIYKVKYQEKFVKAFLQDSFIHRFFLITNILIDW